MGRKTNRTMLAYCPLPDRSVYATDTGNGNDWLQKKGSVMERKISKMAHETMKSTG
jgi:hypothetical protein